MEAKACAKSMVWKDARRRFYWAVRAKIAWSSAIASIATASPDSTAEYRTQLLQTLAEVDASTDRREAAAKLEALELTGTLAQLKADHIMRSMLALSKEDRKATVNGLARLVDNLNDDEKATLVAALQGRSPGTPPSVFPQAGGVN